MGTGEANPLDAFRQFSALERGVSVLSLAMFAFSLGYQMTSRYMAGHTSALGPTALVIGSTVPFVISAVYPHPGGVISNRIGSDRGTR